MYLIITLTVIALLLLAIVYKKRKAKNKTFVYKILKNKELNLDIKDQYLLRILQTITHFFENNDKEDPLNKYAKPLIYFEILCLNLYLIDRYIFDKLPKEKRLILLEQYLLSMSKIFTEVSETEISRLVDNRILFFNKLGAIDKILYDFDRLLNLTSLIGEIKEIKLEERFVGFVISDAVLKFTIDQFLKSYYYEIFPDTVLNEVDIWISELN
jgi:hypothetical protein